jgi:glycosyltransferase involved in cell wall biosynthesis
MQDQATPDNRNVIVTTEYAFPYQNSTGYYWSKIIEKIKEKNKSIIVICREPKDKNQEKKSTYKYIHTKEYELGGLKKRLSSQLKMTVGFVYQIYHSAKKNDIIITGTNPIILIILFPILHKIIKFKWILLVHDVFPNYLIPYKILKKNLLYKILEKISTTIYKNSDEIITIGRDMDSLIKSKSNDIRSSHVIQNWASPNEINVIPKKENHIIKKINWEDFTVFGFFGNIGNLQGIQNILNATKLVKNEKAAFLFIGNGNLVNTIKDFISTHPNIRVAYGGSLPMEEKNIGLSACDVAIISLESNMLGVGVPSKAYFSIAADKPLLAIVDHESEISQMVLEEDIGWQCTPDNPIKLAALIDHICEIDISKLQGKPRRVLEEKYSEEKTLNKIMSVIENMAAR